MSSKGEKNWREHFKEILIKNVRQPYDSHIDEFINFLDKLIRTWDMSDENVKSRYAYHITLLQALSNRTNVIRAKLNAYYAYLVFRKHASAYKLMKSKVVAGGESLYTWLRMYRDVMKSS
ncbi:MAG: hypothetical protein GXO23_01385 [Crenarchaeota archaeon]|nr:hypothetical protein [Thermoproteota archaeon]